LSNHELLNLADYTKKDVIRYLLNNYTRLRSMVDRGDSVAHSIIMDLNCCLEHEYLQDTQREALIDFYIKQYRLTELAEDYKLTPEGVKYRIQGGINRIYELLNNKCEYKLYGKGVKKN